LLNRYRLRRGGDQVATVSGQHGPRGPRGPYAKTPARRREIVDAALSAFAEHGYRGASLRAIAERVGITHAALLHHFGGKEQLLAAVLQRRDERDTERLQALAPESFGAALEVLVGHNTEQPELIRLFATLSAEATAEDHPAREFFERRYVTLRAELTRYVTELQAAGQVARGVRPEEAASLLVAVMDGLQVQWLLDPSVDMAKVLGGFLRSYFGDGVYAPTPPGIGAPATTIPT
jgi:AcrR family transcriptional regulator